MVRPCSPCNPAPASRIVKLANDLALAKAIIVVSAHWESRELLVTGNPQPQTWHDFHGFPAALYAVQYPAPVSRNWPDR